METINYWEEAKFYFINDDGSLQEIRIKDLSDDEALAIFEFLLSSSNQLSNESMVWVKDLEMRCNQFKNKSELFIALKKDTRHILLEGLTVHGIQIPNLGCTVYDNQIELNYRMG